MEDIEQRWECQFCKKLYKPTYKYKNHLSRCIAFNAKLNNEREVVVECFEQLKK